MFEVDQYNPSLPHSSLGFAIDAPGLGEVLDAVAGYGLPIYITENGAAYDDPVGADGAIHDERRIAYLDAHLWSLSAAVAEGVDVRGYFQWSLLDNFEWDRGYRMRFGIVHVDFETQQRTPHESALWYRDVIAANGPTEAIG